MICPGYKSHFDVAWRDQNVVAEKSVQRRKNATKKAYHPGILSDRMVKLVSLSLPRTLAEDHEGYAVNFFLSSYILLPREVGVQRSFLDCLYPVWIQTEATSPLRPAVAAVASCLLAAWSQHDSDLAISFSGSLYLKGVASLRKVLQGNGKVGDDVVMAALMLEMYESVRAFLMSEPRNSPHIGGTVALVEHRRRRPFASEVSQRVLLGARNQIIGKALRNLEAVPSNISKWPDIASDLSETPAFRLDVLKMEVANIQYLVSQIANCGPTLDVSVFNTLRKATELDQRLLVWTTSVSDHWATIRVSSLECIPQSVRDAGLYQDFCDVYGSIFIADMNNECCCARTKVQVAILTCLEYLSEEKYDAVSITTLEIIQEMADTICASIPYHLGDRMVAGRIDEKTVQYPHNAQQPVHEEHPISAAAFGGWLLATRLPELLSLRVPLRVGQREWIGGQMKRILRIYALKPPKTP